MKNIGKYNGIPCYTCTNVEWKDCYDRGQDNGKQIFIIDGVMVKQNVIIGNYDGKHVKDLYDGKVYYMPAEKPKVTFTANDSERKEVNRAYEGQVTAASYEELVNQNIDFSKYSIIVDEFFALLEV